MNSLEKEWEKHAYAIFKTLKNAGAMPDMIQIGNEITNGTAWPIARVQFPGTGQKPPFEGYYDVKQWGNLKRLLRAEGARARKRRRFEELLDNMVQCSKRYKDKEFMVVETGYSAGGARRGGGAAVPAGAAVGGGAAGVGVSYWAPERAIRIADGTPGPAVLAVDNLTKLTKRPESHVPIQIKP